MLSKTLKNFIDLLVPVDQSYCVPARSMLNNLFTMRDVFAICETYDLNVGIISIDQEKVFDRGDHTFLFFNFASIWCRKCFSFLGKVTLH